MAAFQKAHDRLAGEGRPDGTIAVALYSSGPLGRLVWQDVLSAIQHWKKRT